jgi:protein gp37
MKKMGKSEEMESRFLWMGRMVERERLLRRVEDARRTIDNVSP